MNATEFKERFLPLTKKLYRVAFQLTGNTMDAEDLVQDTFLKLWQKRNELDEKKNIEAYFMETLKNLSLNLIRNKKETETNLADEWNLEDTEPSTSHIEVKEEALFIREMIEKLPDKQKKIMELKHIGEFDNQEISHLTGETEENIRAILSRCRKKIKEQFVKYFI